MNNLSFQISRMLLLLRAGQFATAVTKVRERMYSNTVRYCLRRDLSKPFGAPQAQVAITVRPMEEGDAAALFRTEGPHVPADEIVDRTGRIDIFRQRIPTGYVAIDPNGVPCYAQWLMSHADNDRIQGFFKGLFPVLHPDEALLEGAFTPESHRGFRIMPRAMALLAEKATDFGARYVITFVAEGNTPSLKGCKRAGFVPHYLLREEWRLFRRRLIATPLPEGTPYPFDMEESKPRPVTISPSTAASISASSVH